MKIHARPLAAFGAMFACAAMPGGPVQAASTVQIARAQDLAAAPEGAVGLLPEGPDRPPAIADSLHDGHLDLEIRLGGEEPAARDESLLALPFDVSQQ